MPESLFFCLFALTGAQEEKRHQRRTAANQQTEGNDANAARKGGRYSEETSGGVQCQSESEMKAKCKGCLSYLNGMCFMCFYLQMDMELQSVVGLVEATLIEKPPQITKELPAVLHVLIPLMQSPLAAPRIQKVFLDIGTCLMPKHLHSLGTSLS